MKICLLAYCLTSCCTTNVDGILHTKVSRELISTVLTYFSIAAAQFSWSIGSELTFSNCLVILSHGVCLANRAVAYNKIICIALGWHCFETAIGLYLGSGVVDLVGICFKYELQHKGSINRYAIRGFFWSPALFQKKMTLLLFHEKYLFKTEK